MQLSIALKFTNPLAVYPILSSMTVQMGQIRMAIKSIQLDRNILALATQLMTQHLLSNQGIGLMCRISEWMHTIYNVEKE